LNIPVSAIRWGAAAAAAGVLMMSAATGASAATAPATAPARTTSAKTVSLPSYTGIQGGNLCLLSRCVVGGSGTAGGPVGPSNTQGFNLCLLSLCTI